MTTSIPELKGMHMMTEADKPRFADCSGEAYVGYPLFDWMFRGRADSERSHAIWKANYAAFTPSVIIYSDSAEVRGTAIFVSPECGPVSDWKFLSNSPRLLWPHMARIVRYSIVCESVARQFMDERTWYLYDLAVRPQYQGKGVASQLLRPMLAYFDRVGANCNLETHDAKNVAMYEHFGFALVKSPCLPHSELRHYAMLRKPTPNAL